MMLRKENIDLLIIGSGPAGMSAALHLVQADPSWAHRLLVLEKAEHPREKICGGGITRLGDRVLADVGLTVDTPHIPINDVRILYHHHTFAVRDNPVFRVVERAQFDHWLCRKGEALGIRIRQNTAALDLIPRENGIEVVTERGTILAKTVIAADGSNSPTRKKLGFSQAGRKARLLEILTEGSDHDASAFQDGVAVFDFRPMSSGVQGYYWDFPSLVGGRPMMNRGIFDSRAIKHAPRADLKRVFRDAVSARHQTLEEGRLKSFPIYGFDPSGEFAKERVLLAGDAAGADPFLGEGISFALAYGQVASEAVLDAFRAQDFRFQGYRDAILSHAILRQLRGRWKGGRLAYRVAGHPHVLKYFWNAVPWLFQGLVRYRPHYVPMQQPKLLNIS